jgi:hypothetical protein
MYKLKNQTYMGTTTQVVTFTSEDGAYTTIPMNPDNTDYQAYLKWLEEGNEPLPADEQGAE